jgi:hypothetical protein
VTASTALAASAASTALPPSVNADIAAWVASWSAVTATARVALTDVHGTLTVIAPDHTSALPRCWSTVTVRSAIGRRGPAVISMAVGAVVMVGGSLLPWVRTGGARRNSYDLLSLIGRLGFAPDGPAELALRWWPLVPLLAAVAVVAAWWGWPRTGGVLGALAALYGCGVGVTVSLAGSDLVHIEPGAVVTIGGAVILAAGSIAAIFVGWRRAPGSAPAEELTSTRPGQ